MAVFEINMVRERVMPPAHRTAWLWFRLVYLGACGALLAYLLNTITRDVVAANQRSDELSRIEAKTLRPGSPSGGSEVLSYAHKLGQEMARHVDALDTVNRVLGRRPSLAQILAGLATPLPAGARLGRYELGGEKREMVFDIYVVPDGTGEGLFPRDLIALWRKDAALTSALEAIESLHSQQTRFSGRSIDVWTFTCRLTERAN